MPAKNKFSKYLQPMDFSSSIEKEMGSIDFGSIMPDSARRKEKLFLRSFKGEDLYKIMADVKLIAHLEAKGFSDLKVEVDVDDAYVHYMKLYYRDVDPDNILLDLRLSESRFVPEKEFFEDDSIHTYDMVVIEWLSAQNPLHKFNKDKPQLPGQKSPGLGILNYCFEMMYVVAREVIKDGFLDIPDHMHGAIMYSRKFKFFNPAHEGILRAIMRDLGKYSLSDISWGIITQTIIEEYKNQPQAYAPSEQVFYVSDRMRDYFRSKKYTTVYNKYFRRKHYRFEYDEMIKRRESMLKNKNIVDL
ncbi:MAG: hypothetical protein KA369_11340 [Spirochaetes bacterium]|nr:hypothetical protein [Spirochaetota bacterium]